MGSSTHRYYIVSHMRVPEGFKTNDYEDANNLLKELQKIDRDAWICDNKEFGTWEG